ncbi:hypothetical protein [Phenylobacterium sp.]|jgi:hypothetical protein|uniref:hypothetical protein n=1 Tax=Phenylobacterium sp. TaxID=1871053 RepID=UPI002E359004|nr:hypothetical protein [Phenylobacterium sp.]
MPVQLVELQPVAKVETPPAAAPPTPVQPPPPPRDIARRTPPRPDIVPVPASEGPSADGTAELSDAQIASAATAGSGPSGRPCDMVRRLQAALRKDPQVQAAVADARAAGAGGKALFVWNGDWIRSNGQDGAGLAAVREAIMWEVGFAPEACRTEPVHGLVMISLNDGPGAPRLVVGAGAWRWTDLLRPRPGGGEG